MSICLLLLILIHGLGIAQDDVQEFKLEIMLSKDIYLEAEPIWLDVTLTNISEVSARAWGLCLPCQLGFEVTVINKKGDTLDYTGPIYEMILGPGWIMQVGESYYQCLNLSEYFGQWPEPRAMVVGYLFTKSLNVGEFLVVAKHHINGKEIISNQVTFEVKPATGEEEKPYQLLREAYDLYRQVKHGLSKRKLEEILGLYPKSVYAQNACRDLFLWEDLINRYPDSGFSQNAILAIASGKKQGQVTEFLHEIIKEYPNTRSAKFAEQMLQFSY
jgi:hypothetical protein